MSSQLIVLLGFFILINLSAFMLMFFDKNRSRKQHNRRRISEGMLFFMATFFGSIGVYLGMFAFRHKTQKWYFTIGIPLLILQNIAFLYLIGSLFELEFI
ncbi:DUF1294 domain-containing protein [bacterium]|jgi:uncharacterized membrane protein YsdA (DUF1294 family)|nr:DUF1294 domain-containing protein [bacterium]MBT4250783.1 DUF1294 domain-containing protein [bacterium]MBT4598227.1 DUF1294 domain-containing protein [bacterium]MBT6753825.1 DUF1294 domain-containing protein [bacterium]MBT7037462.1 DUF1294 domain-containing protein [bacterium]